MRIAFHEFQDLVRAVMDTVPAPFDGELSRVPVVVLPNAPEYEPDLYGLYQGIPLTERAGDAPDLPSTIEIYMLPLCDDVTDLDELREEVRITLLHELGHHLGMNEDDLDRLGYA